MQWKMESWGEGRLKLEKVGDDELSRADSAIARFTNCGHPDARTTGDRLANALAERELSWLATSSLAQWCNSSGAYERGVRPAQEVSRSLFNGQVLPGLKRLASGRTLSKQEAREMVRSFVERANSLQTEQEADDAGSEADSSGKPETPSASGLAAAFGVTPAPRPRRTGLGSGGVAEKGSRYCIQRCVNEQPEMLWEKILAASPTLKAIGCRGMEWKSPLAAENYYEYRDDFLRPLGLSQHEAALREFWPSNGPQWDALGLFQGASLPGVLLVEAKAHPGETASDCKAEHPDSVARIDAAFRKTRAAFGAGETDWKRGLYQLANRIAFLYFLNEELGIPTWLALVNFVEDASHRPTCLQEWERHQETQFSLLGIDRECPLFERIVVSYVDPLP